MTVACDSYRLLLDHVKQITLLDATARLLSWDQETMMPSGAAGVEYRARQAGQLAKIAHAMETDARVGQWLADCESDPELTGDPESDAAVNVRESRRDYDAAVKLPSSLVEQFSRAAALSKHAWAQARSADDFALFRPHLEEMIRLCRAKADCWGYAGGEPWDALADHHEPGMNAVQIARLFGPLRAELLELLDECLGSSGRPDGQLAGLSVPAGCQQTFSRTVAAQLGFDFSRGRLDESQHPFCLPIHRDDVRMTSRYREDLPLDGLSSVLHETGHGIYNQNLPGGEALDTPLARPLRYAIHESQARLIENHVGRSRAFWAWCGPQMRRHFAPALDTVQDDGLFAISNVVQPSLIRTEADELTYHLHILVRFDLERALISGDLAVADLPAAWDEKYERDVGIRPPDDSHGCLQDIHWSLGAVGYFPTYTLGSLYAAQFFEAAELQVVDLDCAIARGDFTPLVQWLSDRVHRHGRRYSPESLCRRVTGRPLEVRPMLNHLRKKLSAVYPA